MSIDSILKHYTSEAETRGYVAGFLGRERASGASFSDIAEDYITRAIFNKGIQKGFSQEDLIPAMQEFATRWFKFHDDLMSADA